jgi:hypothetical protein
MPYRQVSVDIKRAAVRMTLNFDFAVPDVATLLNISPDTIRRAIRQHNETGDVVMVGKGGKRGRKKILDEDDLKVRYLFCNIPISRDLNHNLSISNRLWKLSTTCISTKFNII